MLCRTGGWFCWFSCSLFLFYLLPCVSLLYSTLPSSFCSCKLYSDNYWTEGGLSNPRPAFIDVRTEAWEVTLPKVTQQCVAELQGQSLDDTLLQTWEISASPSGYLLSGPISVHASRALIGMRLGWPLALWPWPSSVVLTVSASSLVKWRDRHLLGWRTSNKFIFTKSLE